MDERWERRAIGWTSKNMLLSKKRQRVLRPLGGERRQAKGMKVDHNSSDEAKAKETSRLIKADLG